MQSATFVKGIAKYPIREFWKAHEGPNAVLVGPGNRDPRLKQLQDIACLVRANREVAAQDVTELSFSPAPYIGDARKRKNAESLANAANSAQENQKRRRFVSLDASSPKASKAATPSKKLDTSRPTPKKTSPAKTGRSPRQGKAAASPKSLKSKVAEDIEKALKHGVADPLAV